MKQGFVISLDALIALLVLLSLMVAASSYLAGIKHEAGSSLTLKEVAMDSITVLEKGGTLEKAISTDKVNEIRAFLNRMPANICGEINVYAETDLNNQIFTVLRPGCLKNFKELATIERSVVVENNGSADLYLAKINAWYKVSG